VRSDRYKKTKGIPIDTPAETPTETPTPTPVIETPADAPVFTENGLLLNLLKETAYALKKYHYRKLGTAEVVEFMTKNPDLILNTRQTDRST
jgi:hypothetical protein